MNHPSPATDPSLARPYSVKTLEQKVQNKTALQKKLGWPAEPKRPMVCLPLGMTEELGGEILLELIPGLLTLPIEIVILGKGSSDYGTVCTDLAKQHRHRIAIIPNATESIMQMYAASDIALFLSDTKDQPEVADCLRYGVVPIAPTPAQLLENYDPNQEAGNAFLFESHTVWGVFGALIRSLETFRFPFDWRTIQRHCMDTVQ